MQITTSVDRKIIPDRNVVGLIEGADAKLKEEIVIACAHYDHDGVNGTNVLNGADDDGSGTVGVMEIAEAYALAAQKGQRPETLDPCSPPGTPKSAACSAPGPTPNSRCPADADVAVLNMDMIGRNEEVPDGGGARFRGLDVQTAESNHNAVEHHRHHPKRPIVERGRRSGEQRDRPRAQLALRQQRLATDAPQRPLAVPQARRARRLGAHRPSPRLPHGQRRPDKINYPKMEKIARLVYQASWDLFVRDHPPLARSASLTLADRTVA